MPGKANLNCKGSFQIPSGFGKQEVRAEVYCKASLGCRKGERQQLGAVTCTGEHLQAKWEEQNKEELLGTKPSVELKVTEAKGDSPVPQSKYFHSSSPCANIPPQNPPNEPQEALDETRTVKRPVEPATCALEVLKPLLEPKDDLHKAPEQAGSHKVEEVKQKIEAKMRSKVVAQRKPPEEKTQRKGLKSVIWRMKDIIPGLWTAHSNVCPTSPRAVYLKGMKYMEERLYGVLHQVFKTTKLGIKLNLKHMKVFEGSNQLKTPSKLSFRFQGAVVPLTLSTELEGSSLLQQSALSLF
ncbi:hypothetical protein F5141DRAFT_1061732 [Pisolithus sp. B1]|nr:hypothetical protein F5141DRAFT_1061732 [Pisolithus sp. B1]